MYDMYSVVASSIGSRAVRERQLGLPVTDAHAEHSECGSSNSPSMMNGLSKIALKNSLMFLSARSIGA